ncbi:transglutaminase-like domain-containing protein [Candidatus Nitronereus thalassa]|uniref:Transglutaminase-like domain-containing protein n=1 Tax=Candidatus Nitronereus thalassa TaxID=3020898 RepID=A0ABU3K7T8_9BACT|nr:transglutaminase-like domain-containing protein [Candidatus Nitronereus thalassa]MDT7042466.1 transglutaminase-like domain-containing protein [Candidatus Nitronereus thalassa]
MKNQSLACAEFSESQIHALIHLLSDPDHHIAQTIHDQLVSIGHPALPLLGLAERNQENPILLDRLSSVIADIRFTDVEHAFQALTTSSTEEVNLEAGAFLIARTAYPDLEVQSYQRQIEDIANILKQRCEPGLAPRQAIQTINQHMFVELGFKGNIQDYYNPNNSFLHQVLDHRIGIPISLSVLYLLIAQRLNVPVVGVGMPGHFMVRLKAEPVFIDCFNQGVVLSEKDCAKFLDKYGVDFDSHYLDPVSNNQILARMIRNLVAIYQKRDESNLAEQFTRLLNIVEPRE